MDSKEREMLAYKYCANDMRELRKICYPMILHKGVDQQYEDDLISVALRVLWESITTFDKNKKCSFHTFLIGNIKREYWTWTRDMERECRCNLLKENGKVVKDEETGRNVRIENIYIDAETEEEHPLSETIASNFDIEQEVAILIGEYEMDDKVEKYLNSLPEKQKRIAKLLSCGYEKDEIIEVLHMSKKEFKDSFEELKAYEKVRILF